MWNESASAFWSSHKWFFQPTPVGHTVIDLNKADANHLYVAMTRPQLIDTFMDKVINHLRTQPSRVNLGYLFNYSYDSAGTSDRATPPRSTPAAKSKAPASTV